MKQIIQSISHGEVSFNHTGHINMLEKMLEKIIVILIIAVMSTLATLETVYYTNIYTHTNIPSGISNTLNTQIGPPPEIINIIKNIIKEQP